MNRTVQNFGSRFLRFFYRPGCFYPFWIGPLRGLNIRYGANINIQEMLGLWERNNFAAIIRLRNAGLFECTRPVMYDIGANFGLYALFFSRLLQSSGRVFAFEPVDAPAHS
jgi:hypothetical protein